ncbi:MAG: acyl-CoA thioesterase [bacterium]
MKDIRLKGKFLKPSSRINRVETRVLYADTDHGGVAYYASYLRWFEIGRTELFRKAGLTYADVEKSGILSPVIEVFCKYLQPAKYDEILVIDTWIEILGLGSITFGYQIRKKSDDSLLATGKTINAFVNRSLKPTRPPKAIYNALSAFIDGSL